MLDSGARGSTTTFVERGMGDVLIAWENEGSARRQGAGQDKFEIVVPSASILVRTAVSVVDKVVDKKGTRAVAQAYLEYLYSPEGQEIAAKHYYRPRSEAVAKKYARQFPKMKLFTLGGRCRRLAEGAEHAFCRWRRVRPDLSAKPVTQNDDEQSASNRKAFCRVSACRWDSRCSISA